MQKDQLPATGCENCGKHKGKIQQVLRKHLFRVNSSWLCSSCANGR